MRVRTPDRETTTAGPGPTFASRLRRLGGHLLTAVGLLTFTYAVLRVLGPRDDVPVQSVDEAQAEMGELLPDGIRSRAADAVPADRSIDTIRNRLEAGDDNITETTIEGPRSDASEFDPGIASPSETEAGGSDDSDVTGLGESSDADINGSEADEGSGDAIDETAANAEYTEDERSDAEIAERSDPDAGDEPAEPGEMAVDEDVAENLVDDEIDADAESHDEGDESEE